MASISQPIPANLDAERGVLGGCIEDPDILSAVLAEGLDAGAFSVSDHRQLWKTIEQMCDKGEPISLIALADTLPGLTALLADLVYGAVISERHIVHLTRLVKKKAKLRRLLGLGEWLTDKVEAGADPDSLIAELNHKISQVESDNEFDSERNWF